MCLSHIAPTPEGFGAICVEIKAKNNDDGGSSSSMPDRGMVSQDTNVPGALEEKPPLLRF